MANELAVTGNTRLTWSLTEAQVTSTVSRSAEQKSSRNITHGTGANQANVAWSERYITTGLGGVVISSSSFPVSSFGYIGYAAFYRVKEALLSVATGPTGGYVTFGMPATGATGAVTGVRVYVGGQFHWLDYLNGLPVNGDFSVTNGVTGTYDFELSLVGNGIYEQN